MRFRRVPGQKADEVPEGCRRWLMRFTTVPGQIAKNSPRSSKLLGVTHEFIFLAKMSISGYKNFDQPPCPGPRSRTFGLGCRQGRCCLVCCPGCCRNFWARVPRVMSRTFGLGCRQGRGVVQGAALRNLGKENQESRRSKGLCCGCKRLSIMSISFCISL